MESHHYADKGWLSFQVTKEAVMYIQCVCRQVWNEGQSIALCYLKTYPLFSPILAFLFIFTAKIWSLGEKKKKDENYKSSFIICHINETEKSDEPVQ